MPLDVVVLNKCLSRRARLLRWMFIGMFGAPVLGTILYNYGYRIEWLGCPISYWTGIPTPTCGMTRSFMAFMRGDWGQSLQEHLFGPFFLITFVIAAAHFSLELVLHQKIGTFYTRVIVRKKVQLSTLCLFLAYYLLRLSILFSTEELQFNFSHSPLGKLFL